MTLLVMAGAWVAGVYLASHAGPVGRTPWLFVLSALLVAVSLKLGRRSARPAVFVVLLFLGLLRAGGVDGPSPLTSYHHTGVADVRGLVAEDSETAGSASRFRLRVESLSRGGGWTQVSDDILVTARAPSELLDSRDRPYLRYGDRVQLSGLLEAPPELDDFDYPGYLARIGIESVMSFPEVLLIEEGRGSAFIRVLRVMRLRLAASLAESVPEPESSLVQALLLGLRDNLPDEMTESFRRTGTAHVLAISGLHVGILLALSLGLSGRLLGRRRQLYLLPPLVLVWLYALLSGMSPSVTRAAIMGSVYLAALFLGRPRSVLPALGLAAAVMVAVSPSVLWSVSFQLSFAAMIGIAALAGPIAEWLRRQYDGQARNGAGAAMLLDGVSYSAAMTIGATATTLPLVMLYFERVSLVGLPTTLLVLPALPIVLVTGALTGLAGLIDGAVAEPIGWLAWLASTYVTSVVDAISRLPGVSVDTGPVAPFLVLAYYAALVVLAARPWKRPQASLLSERLVGAVRTIPERGPAIPWWALAAAVAVASLLWLAASTGPDGRLHVSFVDVGQGDATLIETPGGRRIVVDGGQDPMDMVRFLGSRMPFQDRAIDMVVLTHGHSDHVTGLLEVLRRYDVETVLERKTDHDGAPYLAWHRAVDLENAEVVSARAGMVVSLDSGAFIEVLGPPERLLRGTDSDVDNASVVLRLVYGDVSFLLMGDAFAEAENALIAAPSTLDSEVLSVGHHGSRTSSSRRFLEAASPSVAVISAGKDNRFGHPHPETLEALAGYAPTERTYLTADHGTIELITDGKTISARTER